MNSIIKIFIVALKVLNYWFFVIPGGRFALFVFVGHFLIIDYAQGDQPNYLFVRQLGGAGSLGHIGFYIIFGIPFFWSFISMFAMTSGSPRLGSKMNSTLDNAIAYRNGQMNVASPKEAAEILQKTSHLDAMKIHGHMDSMKSAEQGFNAKYGSSSPSKVYKDIMKK